MTRAASVALVLLAIGCDAPAAARDPSAPITALTLPEVELERADGAGVPMHSERPTLLHFWATWCAPCRRELPRLLAMGEQIEGVRVIAVTDEPWRDVRAHFGGSVPRFVARDPEGVLSRALGVDALPDTYLVDARGVARRRVAGALDWTRPAVRAWVESLSARAASP